MECKVCGRIINSVGGMSQHISHTHKMGIQEYYDKFLKKEKDGICKCCGRKTTFISLLGYREFCSSEKCFSNSEEVLQKREETNMKKYGTKSPAQNKEVKNKIRKTNLKKYGTDNPSKNKKIKEKIKDTHITRYGTDNPSKIKEFREKRENTMMKKFGVSCIFLHNETRKKIAQKNMEKYGAENPFASKIIQNKIQDVMMKKYGVKYAAELPQSYYARLNTHFSFNHKKLFQKLISICPFFEKEVKIGNYSVDIANLDKKLIIECYGDYWHCNPREYNPDYYHKQLQKTAKEKWQQDNDRIEFLKSMGFNVLVYWDSELRVNFDNILEEIISKGDLM